MFWEIDEALSNNGQKEPTHVLVQIGVGSLADAAVHHYRREQLQRLPVIIGIEPESSACVLESVKAGRIVHLAVGEQEGVTTASDGDGFLKRITILPQPR